jgi:ABC-2 type transport system permease protein
MNAVTRLWSRSPDPSAPPRRALGRGASPFYWSLRRELWEHRSIYLAPLIAAGVVLSAIGVGWLRSPLALIFSEGLRAPEASQAEGVFIPLAAACYIVNLTVASVGFFIGALYCLDALYGERRNRGILFWKSLPVSDRTAVLAKACAALVVLPCILFATMLAADTALLLVARAILTVNGESASDLWIEAGSPTVWLGRLYIAIAATLWYAPVYSWLLLVSAFAPGKPLLWALAPPALLAIVDRAVSSQWLIFSALRRRIAGGPLWTDHAFKLPDDGKLRHGRALLNPDFGPLDPVTLFGDFELWAGLAVAVLFLLAAIWLRRRAEPI